MVALREYRRTDSPNVDCCVLPRTRPVCASLEAVLKIVLLPLLVLFFGAARAARSGSLPCPPCSRWQSDSHGAARSASASRRRRAAARSAWPQALVERLPARTQARPCRACESGPAWRPPGPCSRKCPSRSFGLRAAHLYAQLQVEQPYALELMIFVCVVVLNTLLDSGIRKMTGATTSQAKSKTFG